MTPPGCRKEFKIRRSVVASIKLEGELDDVDEDGRGGPDEFRGLTGRDMRTGRMVGKTDRVALVKCKLDVRSDVFRIFTRASGSDS